MKRPEAEKALLAEGISIKKPPAASELQFMTADAEDLRHAFAVVAHAPLFHTCVRIPIKWCSGMKRFRIQ